MSKSAWAPAPIPSHPVRLPTGSCGQQGAGVFDGIDQGGDGEDAAPPTGLFPMVGIFDIKNKHYDVVLERDRLRWSPIQPTRQNGKTVIANESSVHLEDVYAVRIKRVQKPGKRSGYPQGVSVYVATPSKRDPNVLTEEKITLRSSNEENCQEWCGAIGKALEGMENRPTRLRVFVNGWVNGGEAERIFYSKAVPIFQAAGIRLDVIVTTREGSAYQILQTVDLDGYDGLVCVGGEDIVREVVHGLIERIQVDADVIEILPETPLAKSHVPLGIIPAGFFNLVAHSSQGTSDPFTAALHIILGHRQPMDVCAIFHKDVFIRFGFSLMYGFGGDCLRRAERRAKGGMIGARGAEYAIARSLFKLRPYRCLVEYLPFDGSEMGRYDPPCRKGCDRCDPETRLSGEHRHGATLSRHGSTPHRDGDVTGCYSHDVPCEQDGWCDEQTPLTVPDQDGHDDPTPLTSDWISLTDEFLSVGVMALPNLCTWCPSGISPLTHLADGALDLVLVRNAPRGEFVHHLRRHASSTKDQYDFPFVSVHRTRAARVTPLNNEDKPCTAELTEESNSHSEGDAAQRPPSENEETSLKMDDGGATTSATVPSSKAYSMWNIDMELMAPVSMEIRVHKQLLTMFASGINQDVDQSTVSCGCL